nr:zinc finger with ufm1-specific peptidase domain protein [Quercus suber]
MPLRVAAIISNEGQSNTFSNVIPCLAELLDNDKTVQTAHLCNAATAQICKLPHEGPYFCGYRNLQMLLLALGRCCSSLPWEMSTELALIENKLMIPHLQSLIESAWSQGYNSHARIQTGGIKDTRKFIGTSEAEAVLLSLHVPCTGTAFHGKRAWEELLDAVEQYFTIADSTVPSCKVYQTDKLPIFMQRPLHSLTVVGIERTTNGKRQLLVFDPAWQPPKAISRESLRSTMWNGKCVLRRYRKSERYLRKFQGFETLWVDV